VAIAFFGRDRGRALALAGEAHADLATPDADDERRRVADWLTDSLHGIVENTLE